MVQLHTTPPSVRQQPAPGVILILLGGILQATAALHGTRAHSTPAMLRRKFNTGATRLPRHSQLAVGEHGNLQPLRFGIREHLRIDLGGSDI